jgi:hypothetical protein
MYSTKSQPLHDEYPERDVRDAERTSSNRVHRLKQGRPYRPAGVKNAQFRSHRPSFGRRLTRSLVRFFLPVLIGVGGTLVWQYYGGEMVRAWVPSLGWLLPASPPGPAVTATELQQQLKPIAIDLALVRRSEEQLAANQDQLARKQDQMAQAVAALQAAREGLGQQPPAPKAANVAPPKPLQPAAR